MHDLTAQVTSSLLPFPGVTINALGEDEITLDSVLHGKFTVGRGGLAWLACGPHLEAVHAVTGERLSAYTFSGGGEHPPCILAAKDFSWLKRSGLLIGLEEAEGSVLCLYDLGLSRVVKAVVIPGRITAIEPLVSYGGASASTQHLHQSLRWFFGIAAIGTDLGHVLLVDLCLDDLSCNQSEIEASDLQVVTKSPAEIPKLREVSSREGRHLCLQLNGATGVGATALQYIARTNQLAIGFSDGYLHLWNMKALKKEYQSQLEGGKVPVHAFTFQEPENDPRNCCYLWAVQSSQDLEGDMVSLRLLQLAFSERKCLASGKILYEGLEYCEERYSQELSGTAFPLRAQATNTRLLSCQTIEKFRPHLDRDDSMNEVASPDTSVSIFCWQVKAYGQGTPATFIGVFDINRWYHAQMPDSLRTGESLQNCPYLAVWALDGVMQMVCPHVLLDVVVYDRSLSRGLPYTCPPPEQYFNPTTYNFDATCLLNTGIVHLTCSGYQKETLRFLKKAAPCSSDVISTSYSRCLMSGLLSTRLADTQASNLTQEEQLDAILCTAVETSSLGLITGCIKQWTAEEQPGSALNLRYILDWAWNKVVQTKDELDGICAPLFDSSSNFTDPQTMQLLQHSQRLLTNLSTIFHCLLSEAQELTQKGLVGLMNKNLVSSLISKYAQVVLWFCRTGLLPEGSDEDALQISRPFYSHSVISNYYTIRREELTRLAKGKWCADCLMIDGLVGQCGERLENLWKRDEGGTGHYPPPTLHALLDIYLLDNIDEAAKHAIVIYLLLDVMYAFSNKEGASVESFPTAFAIPIGLVKLIQGLWLLDHHDHQSAFELLLHPAASQCQFEWQHERILQALMCQGQHTEALRYFHVTKPLIASTSQAKLCLSVLLHNRCLIEAWSLIRQHSNRLNISELLGFLYETCQEQGLIKELLKLPLGISEQDGLEKFLQGTGGLQNRELLMVHYLQQANYIPALQLNHTLKMNLVNERDPKLKEQSNTRNAILDQYGKVLPRVQRKLAMERAKPYQHLHTIHKEVSRPQPLSTITKRSTSEKVISRAGFINNVLTKIEEVWIGKVSPQSSSLKSPKASQMRNPSPKASSTAPLEPFLGTPITMSSKRKSRLMQLVAQPSCQVPQPLLSPPRAPSSWVSPKSISKASELSLLQTPQVVKRARALAASGPVFATFTPQSILRSSLRPTPVATPSASPGRSITPPLRKENRITFIEEAESPEMEKSIRWTNGVAADNEISLLRRGALLSKATRKSWSSQADEEEDDVNEEEPPSDVKLPPEGRIPSSQLRFTNSPSVHEDTEEETKQLGTQLVLSFETSVQSTNTTLEFYDAPLPEDPKASGPAEDNDEDGNSGVKRISTPTEEQGLTPQSVLVSEQPGDEGKEEPEEPEEQEQPIEKEPEESCIVEDRDEDSESGVIRITATTDEGEVTPQSVLISEQPGDEGHEEEPKEQEQLVEKELEENMDQEVSEEESEEENKDQGPEQEEVKETLEEELPEEPIEPDQEAPEDHVHFENIPESSSTQEETTEGVEHVQLEGVDEDTVKLSPELELAVAPSGEKTSNDGVIIIGLEPSDSLQTTHSEDVCEVPILQNEQSNITDSTKETEALKPSEDTEATNEPEPDLEQSADLTEFVQRHLFGSDLSPPLTRSGIHSTSISESVDQDEEEEETAASTAPTTASQKSAASVTSSEPTGTDSHSVVSVNDSEELSSPASEEDEEDDGEESDEGEEEEDSGSEVEIIEEIQGRPPPLQPTDFLQGQTHFLPNLSEQEADTFSTEMRTVEAAAVGEVLMVRLGTDEEVLDQDEVEEQPESYFELKPSTTLLVPLELVEGQDALVNDAENIPNDIYPASVPNDLKTDSRSSFSLTLDLDEDLEKDGLFAPGNLESENKELTDAELEAINDINVVDKNDNDFSNTLVLEEDGVTEECPEMDVPMESHEAQLQDEAAIENILETQITQEDVEPDQSKQDVGEEAEIQIEEQKSQTPELIEILPEVCGEKENEHTATEDALDEEDITEPEKPQEPAENQKEFVETVKEDTLISTTEEIQTAHSQKEEPVPAEAPKDKEEETVSVDAPKDKEEETVSVDAPKDKEEETASVVAPKDKEEETASVDAPKDKEEETASVDAPKDKEEETASIDAPKDKEEETASVDAPKEDEVDKGKETKRRRGKPRRDETVVKLQQQQVDGAPDESFLLETPGRKNKAPHTPTRRTTRASKFVTFISPLPEEPPDTEDEKKEPEEETTTAAASSPSRSTKRSKQVKENVVVSTPRRATRSSKQEEEKVDIESDNIVSSTTKTPSPGRKRATRTRQQSSSEVDQASAETEVQPEEDVVPTKISGRTKTPTKRKATQSTTPRRATRRTVSVREEVPEPLEMVQEEAEEEPVRATSANYSARKTKVEDEKKKKQQSPSPGRSTRQSSRLTLSVYPVVKLVPVSLSQSVKKTEAENNQDHPEPEPAIDADSALRRTRKKLWDYPEEELPILDPPLEVDSETPVADALIKRLQDEEEKQEVVKKSPSRAKKQRTKSAVDPEPAPATSLVFDPDNDEVIQGESSFIYSPSRRRTRAKKAESPSQSDRTVPVTRSRRKVSTVDTLPPLKDMSDDDQVEEKVSNSKKTSKRTTTRSKAVLEAPLIAEVELLSPLPSPADSFPRAQKGTKAEAPTSTMNLRRKRIMDTVLSKPVTRRKKL